jgi:hypothetical protein
MRRNTISNQQCFKEKNYKTKFSIRSILKKNIILKNQKIKKKNHMGKRRRNSQYFKGKKITKRNF